MLTVLTVLTVLRPRLPRTAPRAARARSAEPQEWSRAKLLAALVLLLVLAVALLTGAGLWVWLRVHPAPGHTTGASTTSFSTAGASDTSVSGTSVSAGTINGVRTGSGPADPRAGADATVTAQRDALAAAAMPPADPAAAQPSPLSTRDPGTITLPSPTGTGPAGIPAGFPHTPQGALGQLAAIDTDVLNTTTLVRAREVVGGWAAPSGPTGESWSGVNAVAGFLSAAGLSGAGGSGLAVQATPMMGQVKAADGPDWVVVCVDFEVDATLRRTARVAVADCQRMVWDGARWLLGPGAEPAPAPSIWPGTDAAITAGWKNLRHA